MIFANKITTGLFIVAPCRHNRMIFIRSLWGIIRITAAKENRSSLTNREFVAVEECCILSFRQFHTLLVSGKLPLLHPVARYITTVVSRIFIDELPRCFVRIRFFPRWSMFCAVTGLPILSLRELVTHNCILHRASWSSSNLKNMEKINLKYQGKKLLIKSPVTWNQSGALLTSKVWVTKRDLFA